jgi:hypothetical protein
MATNLGVVVLPLLWRVTCQAAASESAEQSLAAIADAVLMRAARLRLPVAVPELLCLVHTERPVWVVAIRTCRTAHDTFKLTSLTVSDAACV